MTRTLVVGTRGSALALAQARGVIAALGASGVVAQERVIVTEGDRATAVPHGDGAFVNDLQWALLASEIDLAVHSLKDVPTERVDGILLAAVPPRADVREALVGSTLAGLAPGARVGTGSPRRAAQLRALRADLDIVPIRGNVPTRIRKVHDGEVAAVLLACAGLDRLGLRAEAQEIFDVDTFLPAPGQGALAIETRADDLVSSLVAYLDHPATRIAVEVERLILRTLGGGCMLPVGAYAVVDADTVTVQARVVSSDGTREIRARESGHVDDAAYIAVAVAGALERAGARGLLHG